MVEKVSGWLNPNGKWEAVVFGNHYKWAGDEAKKIGIEIGDPVTKLGELGYLQISGGYAFFSRSVGGLVKLGRAQLHWLEEHVEGLEKTCKQTLVDDYGMVLLTTPPSDYATPLVAPTF